ncbi:hypothetical protein E1162_10455 [Rhodobacteraceae bacterium RKSG542]|uniref:nucleotidyltransferase family protein n=1 Tax=Pseudovibrio flavus TaxID=2529854 RepID=UPI0012BC9966|nr:nucleotidyltransferase family protein [Pseudovibrio flavus]MTI17660.1 hypothetical protein [Pseudovibrio flavus]
MARRPDPARDRTLEKLDADLLADPARSTEDDRRKMLELIVRSDNQLMAALRGLRSLALPDWRVASHSICYSVWSALAGPPVTLRRPVLYISYYDATQPTKRMENTTARNTEKILSETGYLIRLENQARAHFRGMMGSDLSTPGITCTDEWILRSPITALAVGVRLEGDGRLSVFAPYGLSALFSMQIIRNPAFGDEIAYERNKETLLRLWPSLHTT